MRHNADGPVREKEERSTKEIGEEEKKDERERDEVLVSEEILLL